MLLETVTGRMVDIINPTPDQININDIAWGLSRIPRFAGHTITSVPYNVAQHSLLVEEIVRDLLKFIDDTADDSVQEALATWFNEEIEQTFDLSASRLSLKALLHDSAEVYIGDVPSPVKKHPSINSAIKEIEGKLMSCIFKKYSLCEMSPAEKVIIHHADLVARAIEAHAFMHSRGTGWGLPKVSLIRLQKFEPPMTSVVSYEKFLEKFNELY